MPFDVKAHLRTLVEAHGPPGHEDAIRDLLRKEWAPLVDSLEQDRLGSLIGIKRATRPSDSPRRIMLAAHMDEIALMVSGLLDGFILVNRVGGIDARVLPAQPVLVHGRQPLPGIVAAKPPHLLTAAARSKYTPVDELLIDVGLPPEEVHSLVRVGDLVTLDVPMLDLLGTKVAGKAMDDRACVAAVTHCLHELQGMHHDWDVLAVATVQEERGLMGAKTAANRVAPDIAIALDVCFAPQPGVDSDATCEMGGGPGFGVGPNFHPKLLERIRETARQHEIKLQDDILPGNSGTDAWAIQVALEGVPTALLEVPLRSMHSPVETVDVRDIERTGRLMAHFIAGLDANFLSAISWEGAPAAEASS
ncbi:MAG: M20/M25/M40 family metallo-hydrolase [Anaerolineae bacterium]